MDQNVRIIAPAGPTGAFRSVNVSTFGNNSHQWPTVTQVFASGTTGTARGEIPTVCVGATGTQTSMATNGLKTIFVSGYTGPS